MCLKNPVVEKAKWFAEWVRAEGLVGTAGVHGTSASQQLLPEGCRCFGECCKADLTTSDAVLWDIHEAVLLDFNTFVVFRRIFIVSINTSTNGVVPLFHILIQKHSKLKILLDDTFFAPENIRMLWNVKF